MDVVKSRPARPKSRVGIAERTTSTGVVQYRGTAYDKLAAKQLKGPWTSSLAEAKSWRVDAMAGIARGTVSGDRGRPLKEATDDYVKQARAGVILNRNGQAYKPGVVRGLEQSFRLRIVPAFGATTRLGDLRRVDVQRAVDRWRADGLSPSAVRNTLNALRALCRHAERRGEITASPCANIDLPRVVGRRERVASPSEGLRLVAALGVDERPVYALALFAGLRLGELRALRWMDIDSQRGLVLVRRSWDPREGAGLPKSDAGVRDIPIVRPLSRILEAHRRSCEWSGDPRALVLGREAHVPFSDTGLRGRALRRWAASSLEPIGLHEARHTAASWFIAAGVNLKAVSTILGHSSIAITLDRYGHLLPGAEAEAGGLVDAFLDRESAAV
jgi:integrase